MCQKTLLCTNLSTCHLRIRILNTAPLYSATIYSTGTQYGTLWFTVYSTHRTVHRIRRRCDKNTQAFLSCDRLRRKFVNRPTDNDDLLKRGTADNSAVARSFELLLMEIILLNQNQSNLWLILVQFLLLCSCPSLEVKTA